MIRHIKTLGLKFIFININFLILVISCNTKEIDKELISENSEIQSIIINEKIGDYNKEEIQGSWNIVSKSKIGEWRNNEEYYYSKGEFENRFESLIIEISNQYIYVRNPFNCYGDINIIKESTFSVTGTEQNILNEFLKNSLGIEPSSYLGYFILNCEYPLNKIHLFKNKIIFQEYGAYFYVLERTNSVSNLSKKCKVENDTINFTFCEVCEYSKVTDFNALYKDMINGYNIENALPELPKKDTSFKTSTSLKLKYNINIDTIKISQLFEAGENHYLIYKKGEVGIVKQITSPD